MGCRINVSESVEDSAWDDFVFNSTEGHYTQMALWAQVKAVQGWKPIRITYWKDEQIIGGAQILWRTVGFGARMGYVSKGPLLAEDNPDFIRQVIQNIQHVARDHHLLFLAIQPPNKGTNTESILPQMNMWLNFQGDLEKPATTCIDLRMNEEEILKRFNYTKRKWVKRGLNEDIVFLEGKREDLPVFYNLHKKTGERHKFDIQSLSFFQRLWDTFSPRNMVHIFFTKYKGEILTTSINITYNNIVEDYRVGWTGDAANFHPNEIMVWHKLMWGKENGYRMFDFGGLDIKTAKYFIDTGKYLDLEDKSNSYSLYKLQYGGDIYIFPRTYEYISNRHFRWLYKRYNEQEILQKSFAFGYKLIRSR